MGPNPVQRFCGGFNLFGVGNIGGQHERLAADRFNLSSSRFESARPVGFQDFVTGILVDPQHTSVVRRAGVTYQFARLASIAVARDGGLLVADDSNGVIYRISYKGNRGEGR